MSGGGKRSVGPPISKFCSDLYVSGERTSTSDKDACEPLSLCAPVPIRWDPEVAKRILLSSELLLRLEAKKRSAMDLTPGKSQTHHERSGCRKRPSSRNQVRPELDLASMGALNHMAQDATGVEGTHCWVSNEIARSHGLQSAFQFIGKSFTNCRSMRQGVFCPSRLVLTRSAPIKRLQYVRIIPWSCNRSSHTQP